MDAITASVYADIVKWEPAEDGAGIYIFGKVTDETTRDSARQLTDAATFQPALKKWASTWGNVREMHQPSAVGVATNVVFEADSSFLGAKIIDVDAIQKIKTGVYKGLSYGLIRGHYDIVQDGKGGRIVCKDDEAIAEVSIVDHPSHPGSRLTLAKLPDVDLERLAEAGVVKDAAGEEEDATLADQAIALVRQLIAREVAEDDETDTWDLSMLVDVLQRLLNFRSSEQWEALSAAMTKVADGGQIDMNETEIVSIVNRILDSRQSDLVKAVTGEIATDDVVSREEFEAVKSEIAALSKAAAPASVWTGPALERKANPDKQSDVKGEDPERARYEGYANSPDAGIRKAAEAWLEEHPKGV